MARKQEPAVSDESNVTVESAEAESAEAESAEVNTGDNSERLACAPSASVGRYEPPAYGQVVPQNYDIQVISLLLTDDVMKNLDNDQIRMARSAVTTYLGQFKSV